MVNFRGGRPILGDRIMGGRPQSIRFNKVRCGFGTLCIVFLATAGAGAADATPVTGINGLFSTGGPGGGFSDIFSITGAGLISDSLSVGAGVGNADGSHASASNAALADFGRLGVSVAGDGLTPP